MNEQVKAWQHAKKKMSWDIKEEEFSHIPDPQPLAEDDINSGFAGIVLSYGFGDDGSGHADCVLSGKRAWDYAVRRLRRRTWQSPYINFERPDAMRLRENAPDRPKGFYLAKINLGERSTAFSVSQMRKRFASGTGLAHEGLQMLCVTHIHLPDLMSERRMPFMALADYDIAPYGFNDFFDIPQLFSSNGILGLGIGNADHNYPAFGVPTMIIEPKDMHPSSEEP